MNVRMQDVADRAGVSLKTVSNVINDFTHVSAATRERVLAAIAETGYRPNLTARNLARGRSGVIALVVPQLDMPYFASLAQHVLQAADRRGLVVVIQQTLDDLAHERAALAGRFPQRVDGLILSPRVLGPAEIAARTDTTPLVLLGDRDFGGVSDHVVVDNVAAAADAVSHLVELGRTRIAMVGARWNDRENLRFVGYRKALRAHGLRAEAGLVAPVSRPLGELGEQAMTDLLATGERPDGVFCSTDWVALGVLRALARHGLRVPGDVAVVGHDDIPYGRVSTPTLTTVSPDRAAVADAAVEALLALAEGREPGTRTVVEHRLVVRESTGGLPGQAGTTTAGPA